MAVVIAALLPVFLLIVLGFVLKRSLMRLETQWHGLERLTYYVLFPVLLIQTLVKADLSSVPVAGVGGALLLSALAMSLLCLGLRPLLSNFAVDGPAFTSIFPSFVFAVLTFLKLQDRAQDARQVTSTLFDYAGSVGVDAKLTILVDP